MAQRTPALFAGITALSFNQRQLAPSMDHAVLTPAAGRVPGDLVYAAGVGIPAERAGMQFNTPNAVYAAMLGRYREAPSSLPQPARRHHHLGEHHLRDHLHRHRNREYQYPAAPLEPVSEDPFIPIASATFYDITQDGKRKRSGGLPLGSTQLAQWVVRPYSPQAAAMPLSQAPKLQLSWTPATLLFLANGNGPYTLAFGRAGAPGMEHELGHIAPGYSDQELRALPQAEAGTARLTAPAIAAFGMAGSARAADGAGDAGRAGGAGGAVAAGAAGGAAPAAAAGTAATPAARPGAARGTATPSGRGLLWAVLLIGVAGLAYLTVRLLKQPAANGSQS